MRRDVTREEVEALDFSKGWTLVIPYGFDHRDDPIPEYELIARLVATDGFDHAPGIPYSFMKTLSELFGTKNINVITNMEHDLSDVTPGMGPDVEIQIFADESKWSLR